MLTLCPDSMAITIALNIIYSLLIRRNIHNILVYIIQGRIKILREGGRPSCSLPLPFFSPFPLLFPLHLEVGPLKPARGSGGAPAENKFDAL